LAVDRSRFAPATVSSRKDTLVSTAFFFNRGVILAAIALGLADVALAATTYDVNNASAWTTGTGAGANSSVTYGFDYSTLGIPQAPGTSNTQAMILRANVNSGAAAVQGITVSPNGVSLTGDYVVKALVWANSYGGWTTGTTSSSSAGASQMMGLGVGYTGGTLWRGGASTGGGSGVWFAAAGDGGFGNTTTIRDYSAFTGSGAVLANFVTNTSVYYANASGINPWENFNPYYQTAFPGPIVNTINGGTWASTQGQAVLTGTITNGIAGMAWREFTIERTGSAVTWSIGSTPIVTLSGTGLNGVSPDGGVSLTYFDPTTSVAAVDRVFGLVARFEVVPEPTTLALLASAAAGAMPLLRRFRRRATNA
jgi:hypothetical protein